MQFDADTFGTDRGQLKIIPIHHASFVMKWDGLTIYCDPVGSPERYESFGAPSHIVLTHHHGDHFKLETLEAVVNSNTSLVVPGVVHDQLSQTLKDQALLLGNGDSTQLGRADVNAVAMYNVTPERQKFHEKGVGNGYVFDFAGTRVYLASDTEPVPEMENLGHIDVALFPMNLPYTMSPEQVLECLEIVKPKVTYPFHYKFPFDAPGTDLSELLGLAEGRIDTKIRIRDWYRDA